jgi:hypothetical protein
MRSQSIKFLLLGKSGALGLLGKADDEVKIIPLASDIKSASLEAREKIGITPFRITKYFISKISANLIFNTRELWNSPKFWNLSAPWVE